MITKYRLALVVLLSITIYSRFVNLNWDRGWGFHPDENNLWAASRNVELFSRLDPNFYAYGGFPIYLYSLLDEKVNARAVSAGLQVLIIVLLYAVGRRLAGWVGGFWSAALGTYSAGLVQAAHFLTVESLIGFFSLTLLYSLIRFQESGTWHRWKWLVLAALVLGLGIGTKVSFAVFTILFIPSMLFSALRPKLSKVKKTLMGTVWLIVMFLLVAGGYALSNPFVLERWQPVRSTLEYEARVATGKQQVFYTRQFIGTIPGWFQAIHVFPYVSSWLFLPALIGGVLVLLSRGQLQRELRLILLLAVIAALLSFLPLWAKWSRYVVQVLPVIILPAGIGLAWLWEKGRLSKILVIVAAVSFFPPFFSTLSVYQLPDTRLQAADWVAANIPQEVAILSEVYDLGIVPLNPVHGNRIKLFNFYELDEDESPVSQRKLDTLVEESDYFISVSDRVYRNSLTHSEQFPNSAEFYRSLFQEARPFRLVKEFAVGYHPGAEETFEVFDHPRVLIFKKIL